jgi:hypothetical protein
MLPPTPTRLKFSPVIPLMLKDSRPEGGAKRTLPNIARTIRARIRATTEFNEDSERGFWVKKRDLFSVTTFNRGLMNQSTARSGSELQLIGNVVGLKRYVVDTLPAGFEELVDRTILPSGF